MNVEYTKSFDRNFAKLSLGLQKEIRDVVGFFLDYYASRRFPKGLRIHKCGRFLSLTVRMNYRIFVLPIHRGVKFVFVGNHKDAEDYLKN